MRKEINPGYADQKMNEMRFVFIILIALVCLVISFI